MKYSLKKLEFLANTLVEMEKSATHRNILNDVLGQRIYTYRDALHSINAPAGPITVYLRKMDDGTYFSIVTFNSKWRGVEFTFYADGSCVVSIPTHMDSEFIESICTDVDMFIGHLKQDKTLMP